MASVAPPPGILFLITPAYVADLDRITVGVWLFPDGRLAWRTLFVFDRGLSWGLIYV